jgi:hypothetical protein
MLASHSQHAPSLRVRTPESTADALRAHLARHNLRVLGMAAVTLFAVVAAWLLLYFVCTWLIVIGLAALDFHYTRIPRGFPILFAVAGLCAVIYAWIDRWLTPNERARDEKRPTEVVSEFILAIPRMTLAIGGTLAAWQKWEADDYLQAATLLHRVAEEKRVPMSSVRLDIPDATAAVRILFGLQLTQVIDVQREGQEFWLKLNALRPASLRLARESYADA